MTTVRDDIQQMHEALVRLEGARANLRGTTSTALMFFLCSFVFTYWGLQMERMFVALLVPSMTGTLVIWRWTLERRAKASLSPQQWAPLHREFMLSHALSWSIWVVVALFIVPGLEPFEVVATMFAMCAGVANSAAHASGRRNFMLTYLGAVIIALLAAFSADLSRSPEALLILGMGALAYFGVFLNVTGRTVRLATRLSRSGVARRLWSDRSRRRVTAAEMRSAEAKSRAAESRALFVARVSHELRTPLQTILAGLEVLQQRMETGTVDPKNQALLERLSRSTDQVLMLSHDLADFVRWESGTLPVRLADVDVAKLVDDIATGLAERARLRGVRLSVEHSGPAATTQTDAARLRAIVTNLLTNAIKYAPSGAVRLCTERDAQGSLVVTVQDTGPGLPEKVLKVLGSPWNRGEHARVQEEGFGLGLSIVMTLAQEIGATVRVTSSSQGATIHVSIPARQAD